MPGPMGNRSAVLRQIGQTDEATRQLEEAEDSRKPA